jgi:hypothetical protein
LKPILPQNFDFLLEDVPVVKIEQFFIGKVDTNLFKAVLLKVFKPKNIQNVNGLRQVALLRVRLELLINFRQNKIKGPAVQFFA